AQAASLQRPAACRTEPRLPSANGSPKDVCGKLPQTTGRQPVLPGTMNTTPIEKPLPRVDGRLKVTGAATYAAEFQRPRLAYGVLIQSAIANEIGRASCRERV